MLKFILRYFCNEKIPKTHLKRYSWPSATAQCLTLTLSITMLIKAGALVLRWHG